MEFGIALPHIGPLASAEAIADIAARAEALKYDSVAVAGAAGIEISRQSARRAVPRHANSV